MAAIIGRMARVQRCVEPRRRGRVASDKAVVHIPRTAELQLVVLDKEEFRKDIRRLAREARLSGSPRQTVEKMFQMDPQFGNYLYLQRDKKLVPVGPGEPWDGTLTKDDLETAESYRLWCQRVHHFYGGCLGGALVGGRYLDMHGRYIWALALSKSPVIEEVEKALGEMPPLARRRSCSRRRCRRCRARRRRPCRPRARRKSRCPRWGRWRSLR